MAEHEVSADEVVERTKATFAPYDTKVDISDAGMNLDFFVYDDEHRQILESHTTKADNEYQRPSILEAILRDNRGVLELKGYKFAD